MLASLGSAEIFAYVVIPVLIFCARICDVTLGTLRVIFISKGIKYLAPAIGFFEVIIWLLAIGQVMNNLTNIVSYVAYGAGFAAGTYVGMFIEEKISIGLVIVRVITRHDATPLIDCLRQQDYGVTAIDGEGATGPVKMIFTVVQRQDLSRVIAIIKKFNPKAFYSVEEVRSVAEGVIPVQRSYGLFSWVDSLRFYRK